MSNPTTAPVIVSEEAQITTPEQLISEVNRAHDHIITYAQRMAATDDARKRDKLRGSIVELVKYTTDALAYLKQTVEANNIFTDTVLIEYDKLFKEHVQLVNDLIAFNVDEPLVAQVADYADAGNTLLGYQQGVDAAKDMAYEQARVALQQKAIDGLMVHLGMDLPFAAALVELLFSGAKRAHGWNSPQLKAAGALLEQAKNS